MAGWYNGAKRARLNLTFIWSSLDCASATQSAATPLGSPRESAPARGIFRPRIETTRRVVEASERPFLVDYGPKTGGLEAVRA